MNSVGQAGKAPGNALNNWETVRNINDSLCKDLEIEDLVHPSGVMAPRFCERRLGNKGDLSSDNLFNIPTCNVPFKPITPVGRGLALSSIKLKLVPNGVYHAFEGRLYYVERISDYIRAGYDFRPWTEVGVTNALFDKTNEIFIHARIRGGKGDKGKVTTVTTTTKKEKPKKKVKAVQQVAHIALRNTHVAKNAAFGLVMLNRMGIADMKARWKLMQQDPFDPRCAGVMLPHYTSRGMLPFQVKIKFAIIALVPANLTNSSAQWFFLPSPVWQALCTLKGGGFANLIGTNVIGNLTTSYLSMCMDNNGGTVATGLGQIWAFYKMLGGGIKVRSLLPTQNTSVAMNAAPLPITGTTYPNYTLQNANFYGNANGNNVEEALFGQTISNRNQEQLPDTVNFTTYDIMTKPIMFKFRPTGPEAFNMRRAEEQMVVWTDGTNTHEDVGIVDIFAATGQSNGGTDANGPTSMVGWEAVGLQLANLPTTVVGPIAEIEMIYHCQGVSQLSSNFSSQFQVPPPAAMEIPDSGYPNLDSIVDGAREVFHNYKKNRGGKGMRDDINNLLTITNQFK